MTELVNVGDGFSTSFTFNFQDGEIGGGDGMAFVIQTAGAIFLF